MENMNVNAQVVNEVEVKEENVMSKENQNVQAQETEMVKRFCTECGKMMMIPKNSRQTQCDECKEAKRKANASRAKELAAQRKAALGLVSMNMQIEADIREGLKEMAHNKGVSVAELVKELFNKAKEAEATTEVKEIA